MKKIQLASIALASLALASCSQEDGWFSKDVAYRGVVEKNEATRSYNGGNGAFKWNEGDNIKVWTGNGFSVMEMISGADTDEAGYASISGTPQEVGVFPVTAVTSYTDGNLVINYPTKYDNWTVDTKAVNDPLVAYINKGDRQFNFFHAGGVIEWDVKMPAGVESFEVDMPSAVTGDFAVTKTEAGVPQVATTTTSGTNNVVTFNFEKTTTDTEMHFYMPVPTGTYNNIVVWLKNSERALDKKTASMSHTINRGDWLKIELTMGGYTGVIESSVSTEAELVQKASQGGGVILSQDISASQTIIVPTGKSFSLNLNGSKISNTEDIWDGKPNDWSLASVRGGNLTISGNGSMVAKENDCYAVDVQDGGTLTIESGYFNGNIHAVYVEEGTAYIKGGTFEIQQKYPNASKPYEFVLNCYDKNRADGKAKIIVTGGRFINFNPADCWAEGEHTNFVADGYTSVVVNTNPLTYEVVKCTDATNNSDIISALKTDGSAIEVNKDITIDTYTTVDNNAKVTINGGANIIANNKRTSTFTVCYGGTLDLSGYGTLTGPSNKTTGSLQTAAIKTEKGNLNIYGNLKFEGGSGNETNNAVFVDGGTTNIYGGYFHTGLDKNGKANACILVDAYTAPSLCKAACNIYGGVFEAENPQYLLNIQDDVKQYCTLLVYGGTFVGFNPADNSSDGEHTNYVAPGYKSVQTTYNGKTAWKVVKE